MADSEKLKPATEEEHKAYSDYLMNYNPLQWPQWPPLSFEEWRERMAEKKLLLGNWHD